MIIDTHVYCFQPFDSPAGHPTVAEHMALLQEAYAQHHQPAWRVRDRAPGDARLLLDPTPEDPWRLADRSFRLDSARGRLTWTVDGEDFTKQYAPPNLVGGEFTAHSCIAEMDYAGVDVALIHTDHALEKDVAYLGSCVRAYPDRLRSMAPVDEWRIAAEPDAVARELDDAIRVHGLHALKFCPEYAYRRGAVEPWDDGRYRPFWEAVVALGIPVFFTLGSAPGAADPVVGYLDELERVGRWMNRYPGTIASLTHGFPYRAFRDGNGLRFPERIWSPFENPNLHIEVSYPVRIGDWWDYPWRETWPAHREMVERIGPDQLMWGTDMPFQNRFCTYRQSHEYIERYLAPLVGTDAVAKILGGTAARVLKVPRA